MVAVDQPRDILGRFGRVRRTTSSGLELDLYDDQNAEYIVKEIRAKIIRLTGGGWSARYGADFLDEHVSNAMTFVVDRATREVDAAGRDHLWFAVRTLEMICRGSVARVTNAAMRNGSLYADSRRGSSRDYKAWNTYSRLLDEATESKGSMLTDQEKAAVRRRAMDIERSTAIEHSVSYEPLTFTDDEGEFDHPGLPFSPAADSDLYREDPRYTDDEVDQALGGDMRSKSVALELFVSRRWPDVQADSISRARATKARKAVAQHPRGLIGLIDDWGEGRDDADTDSVFSPWETNGRLSDHERSTITESLLSYADFNLPAEDVWSQIVTYATTTSTRKTSPAIV